MNPFLEKLNAEGLQLHRVAPRSVQINLGKICNLTCNHCHVNAGPTRQEVMSRETMDRIVDWIAKSGITTVDLTGGAPEMVPDFRYLVERLRALQPSPRIIDRCNLTILLESDYFWVAEFLANKKVEIIASLPSLSPHPVTLQRGEGTFDASIKALRLLNSLGYGVAGALKLHLAVNPIGLQLPQDREKLEKEFRTKLAADFGIIFNRLFSSANVPVGRFATVLRLNNRFEPYMQSLVSAFDPQTVSDVACHDSINVGWQGEVYDCDFNQQLGMQWRNGHPTFLWDVEPEKIADREIMTGEHCFACVVRSGGGCGSSR